MEGYIYRIQDTSNNMLHHCTNNKVKFKRKQSGMRSFVIVYRMHGYFTNFKVTIHLVSITTCSRIKILFSET